MLLGDEEKETDLKVSGFEWLRRFWVKISFADLNSMIQEKKGAKTYL